MELIFGMGFIALGGIGVSKWGEADKDIAVVQKKIGDLVSNTKAYNQFGTIPNGYSGILALNTNGMTHQNGIISIRKQDKIETIRYVRHNYNYNYNYNSNTHTHTETEKIIDSQLYWRPLARHMLPIGLPNIIFSPYLHLKGHNSLTQFLPKIATEIGTPAQIQHSLATKFNIHHDCHAPYGYNYCWDHYSLNNNMLYLGGRKDNDVFNVDQIALSPESIAVEITAPQMESATEKQVCAGTMVTVGVIGAIGCIISRVL